MEEIRQISYNLSRDDGIKITSEELSLLRSEVWERIGECLKNQLIEGEIFITNEGVDYSGYFWNKSISDGQ
jgi:hypothetical protein